MNTSPTKLRGIWRLIFKVSPLLNVRLKDSLLMTLNCANHVVKNTSMTAEDKAETIVFKFLKLKLSSAPLSICKATISFSDWVRNLDLYIDKDLSIKEHIICTIAFLEIRHINTIRLCLTDNATKTLVISLILWRIDNCNSLSWSPSVGKLQSPKLCSPSCSPCTSTCSRHTEYSEISTGCPSELEFPINCMPLF